MFPELFINFCVCVFVFLALEIDSEGQEHV